ncbi:MAG TPA: GNAT family N-acetyltransferase [Stellaceae bacterium]|jgi:hypothetical protein
MRAVPVGKISVEAWDAAAAASPQAWLFHSADWNALEERYFVKENRSFGLIEDGDIVGLQPLYYSDATSGTGGERLLHSGIHRQTGLALAPGLSSLQAAKARSEAMAAIFALAEELDVNRIQLNLHNLTPESRSPQRTEIPFWVQRHRFFLGLNFGRFGMMPVPGMATCNADQIVDLGPTEEELFANLDQKFAVRKGMRLGLQAKIASNSHDIDKYYAIAEASAARTGEDLAPLDYYLEIWRRFADTGRCAIVFANFGDRPVAACLLLIDKRAASYAAGVCDPEYLWTRANDFLQWSVIAWAKQQGLTHYRLGPFFPEVPRDWPISKVSWFKTKFGGRAVTIIQGSYFRTPQLYLPAAMPHVEALCRADTAVPTAAREA